MSQYRFSLSTVLGGVLAVAACTACSDVAAPNSRSAPGTALFSGGAAGGGGLAGTGGGGTGGGGGTAGGTVVAVVQPAAGVVVVARRRAEDRYSRRLRPLLTFCCVNRSVLGQSGAPQAETGS